MENISKKISHAFELFDKGYLLKAENLYLECLNEISNKHSSEYKQALHGMGYVKSYLNKFEEARNIYNELLKLAKDINDIKQEAMVLHQHGMVERMAENFDVALEHFSTEYKLLENHNLHSELTIATNFYEQGYIHFLKDQFEVAEEIMQTSLSHAKLSNDKICIGCAYRGLGEIYKANGDIQKANNLFDRAIGAFRKGNDNIAIKEIENLKVDI